MYDPIRLDGVSSVVLNPANVAWSNIQIERGKKRPVLDGAGWVFGIPGKLILWNRRVDSHDVSPRTEEAIREYLADNGLDHVKVRINQYAPLDDWRRLRKNKTVGWGYRYTIGAVSVAGEALLPGRLLGRNLLQPQLLRSVGGRQRLQALLFGLQQRKGACSGWIRELRRLSRELGGLLKPRRWLNLQPKRPYLLKPRPRKHQ
jgi:hypothetical protein